MNMRKIIALLLVLVMVCGVLPFAALAEGETVNAADFNTIVTSNANGDSSYNNSYTTTNGWVTANSAIQTGGTKDSNPQFQVIGADNTHKAVCMNGKTSAPGCITSPTLTGGISKLTVNYTKMFTDTKLSATVTLTDLATGNTYTHTIAREEEKNTKYVVWTDEWVLETPITGDFTIAMVNDCPTGATGNKDRMTILSIEWDGAAEEPAAPAEATYVIADLDLPTTASTITDFVLDDNVSISVGKGTKKDDLLRVYANQPLTFTSATPISAVKLVARVSATADSTFRVETSEDGTTWTTSHESIVQPAVEGEIEFSFETPVKYFRIIPVKQIRIRSITLTFGAGSTTPEEPEITEPTLANGPEMNFAYKFGMIQENVSTSDIYYLAGGMSGYYMATTTDITKAIDVYLEETGDIGFYMYTLIDGVKTYINMVVSGTHVNGAYEATASTTYFWNWDESTVSAVINDTVYQFGTRNDKTYTTVGPCNTEKDNFYSKFYIAPKTPAEPEQPEQPEQPETPAYTVVTAPVADAAYKFGMIQEKVSATDVYYLAGGMNGYYMATSKDVAEAIDVYLEETEGGYYMYTLIDGVKTYINMVVSGTHVNGAYEATASTVYTYDAEKKTVIADIDGEAYWFGTRNDKTYTTVGPVKVSYNGFYCQFYAAPAAEPEVPETVEGTITFDDTAKRTEFTNEVQIWTENGITVTNTKAPDGRSNIGDYFNPARFYATTSLKIEFAGMTKLVINCNAAKYVEPMVNSMATDGSITVTTEGNAVTVEFAAPVNALVIDAMAAQVRVDSMTAYGTGVAVPEDPDTPDTPDTPDEPTKPTTPEEIVNAAYALGTGETLEGTYTLTGVIISVDTPYDSGWNNVTVTIVVGDMTDKPIMCFRMKGEGADIIGVGDTITVTGTLKNYNGTVEFDAGCSLDSYVKAENPETPDVPDEPDVPETPAYGVVDPVAGTAYKFGMIQENVSATDVYYLIGGMNGYYMDTKNDVAAAIDVYLEETEGGYYMYTLIDGVKTYINMVVSGTHVNGAYEATASTVYTYDAEKKTVIADIDGEAYWFGTRNDKTYTTVGPVKVSYNGFYCQFYAVPADEVPGDNPETSDFALVAMAALMALSGSALVLLKKKEF